MTEPTTRRTTPLETRLSRRLAIDEQTGCHNWTGAASAKGYARIWRGPGAGYSAPYRVAYELAKGRIPDAFEIDHLCRNPRCCNPDHLEAVTREENILRGNLSWARVERTGCCINGHPYDAENTVYRGGGRARYCRACKRAQSKRSYRARRARVADQRRGSLEGEDQ